MHIYIINYNYYLEKLAWEQIIGWSCAIKLWKEKENDFVWSKIATENNFYEENWRYVTLTLISQLDAECGYVFDNVIELHEQIGI